MVTIGAWSGGTQEVEVSHVLAEVKFQRYEGQIKLDVADALLYDVVLGQDWMFNADAAIYHKEPVARPKIQDTPLDP